MMHGFQNGPAFLGGKAGQALTGEAVPGSDKGGTMFEKILYATDFSDEAREALEYVKKLKDAGGQEVVLLHVIDRRGLDDLAKFSKKDVPNVLGDLEKKMAGEMLPLEKELRDKGFTVTKRIEKGGPCNEILRVADEEKVSVIVVGSHGKSNIDQMLLGTVSYKLVKRVKKPILVIKK